MPDPIWVDSCVIGDIAAGDRALEAELEKAAAGGQKLMTLKAQEEVKVGNPFKNDHSIGPSEGSNAREQVIKRLNIQTDTMGSRDDYLRFVEQQFKFKEQKGGTRTVIRSIEESDAIILSQVAASA